MGKIPILKTASLGRLSFYDLLRLLPLVVRRSGLLLIGIHFVREMSLHLLNNFSGAAQSSGRESLVRLAGVVAITFVIEILWSAAWSFAVINATRAAIREETLWTRQSLKSLNWLMIEGVRSLAAVIWRAPFAVVPALIELLRLLFVPHVVLLEPLYERGQLDALKRSRQVVRPEWLLILTLTVLNLALTSGIESVIGGSGREIYFWQAPGAFFLTTILTFALNIIYEVYLVALFLRATAGLRS